MQSASVYEIVDETVELQQTRFARYNIELRLAVDPGIPDLMCRQTQVGQILTNLLNNACDAIVQSDSTERWVSLSAGCYEGLLYVEVTDSGPPIDNALKTHLMEPFFTTKELGLGMGVGLSLSRAIALDHGGTLTLLDHTEHTCFRLVLPFGPGRESEAEMQKDVTA
jgi:C4-dicarboxylate-specific signal transduction histidine kinase